MKTAKWLICLCIIAVMASCSSFNKLKRFEKCTFVLKRIENIRIANIEVGNIKSYEDFTFKDLAKLAEVFITKQLPLDLTFVIEANNRARKAAVLEKLDYIVMVDKKDVGSGTVENRLEIPPQINTVHYNVSTKLDIVSLFNKKELKDNLMLALKLVAAENIYNEIQIKVKPYVKIGNQFFSPPTFITLKHNG